MKLSIFLASAKVSKDRGFWRSLPFLILIPGGILYHWFARNGWISPFLGGYVNEVSISICIALTLRAMVYPRSAFLWNYVDVFFVFFMAWFANITLLNAALMTAQKVTESHVASLIQLMGCYVVFRIFPYYSSINLQRILLLFSILFAAMVFTTAKDKNLNEVMMDSGNTHLATYQSLSRYYLLVTAVAITRIRFGLVRASLYFIGILTPFLLGARSETIGSILLYAAFEVMYARQRLSILIKSAFILIGSGFLFFTFLPSIDEFLPDNRMLIFVQLGSEDQSNVERGEMLRRAWEVISDNPVFGKYGYYEHFGAAGAYSHNWVSAWTDLGLLGVILYVSVFIAAMHELFFSKVNVDFKSEKFIDIRWFYSSSVGVFLMSIFLAIFLKSFNDIVVATLAGWVGAFIQERAEFKMNSIYEGSKRP